MSDNRRLSTGVDGLDELLGGGLVPGTLTVVLGATGVGKTQLGLHFAEAGRDQEGRRGILFDMTARGDSQNHADYARRLFDWQLEAVAPQDRMDLDGFFAADRRHGDYLHVFDQSGRRVTRRDLDPNAWHDWQAELTRRLAASIAFFYGNFVRGVRRAVVDGIEPVDRAGESIQLELFEYVYHQILRKDPDWVARDLFREHYRRNAAAAAANTYDPAEIGCLLLCTSQETMLDALVQRPLDEGDLVANANTVIYMGRTSAGGQFGRAMYVAKHRNSAATDRIIPFRIDHRGIELQKC